LKAISEVADNSRLSKKYSGDIPNFKIEMAELKIKAVIGFSG
jgi:hypothetical protein